MTAAKGTGSIYLRRADELWVAVIPLGGGRKRALRTGKDRAKVQAALDAWRAANPVTPPRTRAEHMAEARALGTHTYDEMTALLRAATDCRYCGVRLDAINSVRDHIVPIGRGGSDAIDNIQIICWQCNSAKGNNSEYTFAGNKPRPYKPLPIRDREGWYR